MGNRHKGLRSRQVSQQTKGLSESSQIYWQACDNLRHAWLTEASSLKSTRCILRTASQCTACCNAPHRKCTSLSWWSRPGQGRCTHATLQSSESSCWTRSTAWEALLKQLFHKEAGPFWQLEIMKLTRLELSPNGGGACAEISGTPVLIITCKNAQAVTMWSQLFHKTAAISFSMTNSHWKQYSLCHASLYSSNPAAILRQ